MDILVRRSGPRQEPTPTLCIKVQTDSTDYKHSTGLTSSVFLEQKNLKLKSAACSKAGVGVGGGLLSASSVRVDIIESETYLMSSRDWSFCNDVCSEQFFFTCLINCYAVILFDDIFKTLIFHYRYCRVFVK